MTPRTIADFEALKGDAALNAAERKLIAACRAGGVCVLGVSRPAQAGPDNIIRADLLRLLITGGTPDCGLHEQGVWLEGGWIEGDLNLDFTRARGRTVLKKCHFVDRPRMEQAELQFLSLEDSHLPGLWAQGVKVIGSLFLRGVTASRTVDVNGADIGGQLTCEGATFDTKVGKALNAQRVTVGQSLFLRSVTASGTVDVNGADIGGQLTCAGASFDGNEGKALDAQGVTVGADLFLRSVTASGTVDVSGAKIGGQLDCEGATFDGKEGEALNTQGMTVGESLFLRSVKASGTVAVNGAKIGGQLDCESSSFDGKQGKALNAQGVTVGQSLFLRSVTASGTVDVNGADIGGQLTCVGATFDGRKGLALNAQRLRVAQGFFWRGVKGVTGIVSLDGAHVSDLVDDMASWPSAPDGLILDGFTYDRIADGPTDATARLPWLRRGANFNGSFYPQPYSQLAKVLWEMGHTQQARRVLIERTRLLGRQVRRERAIPPDGTIRIAFRSLWSDMRNMAHRLGDWFVYQVTGYGHRPVNALLWLIGLWAFAWLLAAQVWNDGSFAPNSDVVLVSQGWIDATDADCIGPLLRPPPIGLEPCDPNPANTWSAKAAPGMDWDSFSARGYALDLVAPILTLGQTDAWAPSKDRGGWGWTLWWGRWAFEVFGWIVTALGAAAITGIIQRGRE